MNTAVARAPLWLIVTSTGRLSTVMCTTCKVCEERVTEMITAVIAVVARAGVRFRVRETASITGVGARM
jgi:hypothetical protein